MPGSENKGVWPFWRKRFLGILATGSDNEGEIFMKIYKK